MNWEEIGARIKLVRESRGMTQTDLASRIRKTESSVRKYESGLTEVPLSVLSNISSVLGISISWVLGIESSNAEGLLFDRNFEKLSIMEDDELEKYLESVEGFEPLSKNFKDKSNLEKAEILKRVASTSPGLLTLGEMFKKNPSYTEAQKEELKKLMAETEMFYRSAMDALFAVIDSQIMNSLGKNPEAK